MKIERFFSLIADLWKVLPWGLERRWRELSKLEQGKPVVILVSGFAATHRNLGVMRRRLMKEQYNVLVLALDWEALSDNVGGLYRMAEKLSKMVSEVRKNENTRHSKILIVAHSTGGLVARYYIQRLGGSHFTEGLITLATPHRGTWYALLGLSSHLVLKARCLFQMIPKAKFIRGLNEASFPNQFPMVSVYSDSDLLCSFRSTQLPSKLIGKPLVETVAVADVTHGEFLIKRQCYDVVIHHLRKFLGEDSTQTKTSDSLLEKNA